MNKKKTKSRSLALLSILFVGAFLGTAVGAAVFIPGEASAATSVGSLSAAAPTYTIFKDASGYTCAKNGATLKIDFRDTNSRTVIQKAVDKTNGGSVLIKAGSYDIPSTIYTSVASITGEGNGTILKVTSALHSACIMVTNSYYKMDGTKAFSSTSSRPTGITISNLQIDGNRAVRSSGTMEAIGFVNVLNSQVSRVYVHDVIAGQGVYMSNSQYCTVKDSWIYNIGDNTAANYGSGIAFGEASSTKIACSHITINNVKIGKASMSLIDLEPANNVTITNCQFYDPTTWKGYATPAITLVPVHGYAPNDYVTVSGNNAYGAFGEFITLMPSNHSVVSNNIITYTAGSAASIYATSSHGDKITGNVIKTVSKDGIVCVNCNSFIVNNNTVSDSTLSKSDYGVRFYATTGTSNYNTASGNLVTGFQYGIVAYSGCNYQTVTSNVIKSCTVGTWLKGTGAVKTGNILNGAGAW
jgi:parallel beta-helix repeat protein